ncbi:hypothetical protein [Microbispora hainanensis]|uniref:Uncharacterized protein n=1 Tax=Microbispora hainanensis TaxID=568844 RepID=A0A544Z2L2_9ACTN|nr:hypothetical protein [Microbispora hainanensis]TQS23303.1 hypothetical protein FLX08_05410 [Microbispora hainanensis]
MNETTRPAVPAGAGGPGERYAGTMFGLAEQAYELAVRDVKGDAKRSRLPGGQFTTARMRASLATMRALMARHDPGDPVVAHYVAEAAQEVVSKAFELVTDPLAAEEMSRIWRSLKATAPPLSPDHARERIGKAALLIDPDATPRWL